MVLLIVYTFLLACLVAAALPGIFVGRAVYRALLPHLDEVLSGVAAFIVGGLLLVFFGALIMMVF